MTTNFENINKLSNQGRSTNNSLTRTMKDKKSLGRLKSPAERKKWDKRGVSADRTKDFKNQTHTLKSLEKLRNDRKMQKNISASKSQSSIDVVVEEDKLHFDTFKVNYTEFATIRKLVQAINTKVQNTKEDKFKQKRTPKTIKVDLDIDNQSFKKISPQVPSKPLLGNQTPKDNDIDEAIDSVEENRRSRTSRVMEFKTKKNIPDSVETPKESKRKRAKWRK